MSENERKLLKRIDERLARIELAFRRLESLGVQTLHGVTMANQALDNLITQLNVATNNIAARIDRLIAGLQNVATSEQLAELTTLSSQLNALGQDPTNPVPSPTT